MYTGMLNLSKWLTVILSHPLQSNHVTLLNLIESSVYVALNLICKSCMLIIKHN